MPSSSRRWRMKVHHLPGLGGVHAGRGLVQQQQLGLAGQGAGDLQPALVAVGQVLGQQVALGPADRRKLEHARRLPRTASASSCRVRRRAKDGAEPARLQLRVHADQDVLDGRHVGKEADVLVGAGNAQCA